MKLSSKISKIGYLLKDFKSKSKRLGLLLACLCILVIGFQNCGLNESGDEDIGSTKLTTTTTSTTSSTMTTGSTVTTVSTVTTGSTITTGSTTTTTTTTLLPQAQIAIGMWHTCYLKGGGVKCWGNNSYGQLGLTASNSGSNSKIGDVPNEMEDLQPITLKGRAIAIDVAEGALWRDCDDRCSEEAEGTARDQCVEDCTQANQDRQGFHTCALLENGQVKCWGGGNRYGQLGLGHLNTIGNQANEITNLQAVDLGHNAKAIAVGNRHTCALLNNDRIKCWGANVLGQLGYGTKGGSIGDASGEMGSNLSFVGGNNFKAKAISAGRDFTCAIMTDDNVKCWGWNGSGQLGQDHEEAIGDSPNEVSNLNAIRLNQGAKVITTGAYHACAILMDDSAKCWGYNGYGQLGQGHIRSIGDNSGEMVGLQAIDFGSNLTVKAIQAGIYHTCALLSDDNMRCWGLNSNGQLGIGDRTGSKRNIGDSAGELANTLLNVASGTGRRVAIISAGGRNSCFVLDNGDVKCWGHNWAGQLGQGTVTTADNNQNLGDDEQLTSVNPIPLSMNGVCGTTRNICFVGTPNDNAVDDSSSHYKWECTGVDGGTSNQNCTFEK